MNEKQYAPASAKEVTTAHGGILKLSFNAEKFAAWIGSRANAKGYVNLCITPRREVGQYGETHTVWLDTWEPTPKRQMGDPAPQSPMPRMNAPKAAAAEESDDIPF